MKILYLHQYFNTPQMNGGTRSYEMAKRFVASGHEVHMITSYRESSSHTDWFSEEIAGVHVHWLPLLYANTMNGRQRSKAFFVFAYKAWKKAKQIGGDVVFATSTPLTIGLPAIATARQLRIPMVFEVRDLWPELPIAMGFLKNPVIKMLARRLEVISYKGAKHVVALSPGMAAGVKATGYPEDQITVIPNSSDLELFAPDPLKTKLFRQQHPELEASPMVLYAGTLGRINGVDYLIRIAAETKKAGSNIKFVIFGEGAQRAALIALAQELDVLDKQIFIYPGIPKDQLVAAFCAADICTSVFIDLKAMQANSANKVFDALASGTALAINYGGWQAQLLSEHDAGIVLVRDPQLAAQALIELIAAPARLKIMGANARALAEREFSRDLLAQKLENVLLDAVTT